LPEITLKTISHGNEREKISKFRERANTGKISSSVSILPVLSSVSNKIPHLFSTFGLARNGFFWEDI